MTDWKVQLVIDRYDNKKQKIETEILQESLILPILFLIYISGVFDDMARTSFLVIFLSFIDNLRFIALGDLVKEVAKTFEKIAKIVLE